MLESPPIDKTSTKKTFIQFMDLMFAPSSAAQHTASGGVSVVILSGDFGRGEKNHLFARGVPGAGSAWARVNQGRRPNSLPRCTAWVLRLVPSLSKTRLEWVLTVFSLTKSFCAISRLLIPCEICTRISSSRG